MSIERVDAIYNIVKFVVVPFVLQKYLYYKKNYAENYFSLLISTIVKK